MVKKELSDCQPNVTVTSDKVDCNKDRSVTGNCAADAIKPKMAWLTFYCIAVSFGVMNVGWAIVGNNQTAPVMKAKFGWDKEEAKLYLSVIGNVSLFGVAFGVFFGGYFIDKGRRLAIF
jgi:hypothetical protein